MAASTATVSWNETKGEEDMMNGSVPDADHDSGEVISQSERIKRFGVDCLGPIGDGIFFKAGTWKPGGEYVQKLVVRNVSTSVKKLKYKLPSTRYFSLSYPEVITLSPGMSANLDVIFRPVENDPYDDTIYIRVLGGMGGFHVSVRATIDKLIVNAPFGLDLGFCPTHQTTKKVFKLTNGGEIDAPFKWDQPKGFKLEPSSGIIPAGEKMDILVSVVPTDASVLVAQAVCTIGGPGVHAVIEKPILTTKLSAIGKYAYISLSESEINFGEVLTGTHPDATKKEIVLRNTSVVPAEYAMVRHETDQDPFFDLSPNIGVIPPRSEQIITVRYHALGTGSYNLDRFTFMTPGDCRTSVVLSGTTMPCKVTLAKEAALTSGTVGPDGSIAFAEAAPGNSLNFRDVELGKGETRILQLKNSSQRDVHFSILTGADGMFKVQPMRGVIKAEGPPFSVVVSFSPSAPINYYKRIWVLLSDALPLFFDCMGSGYIRAKGEIKEQRPAPLRHAHVQAYRNRAVHGMGGMNPDELDAAYSSGTADPSFFAQIGTTGTRPLSLTTLANPLTRSGEASRVDIAVAHEFFIEDTDLTCKEITSSQTDFDFGYIAPRTTSESKTVNISNNTNGKVSFVWQVPRTVNDNGEFESPAFEVTPSQSDINPGQTCAFKILFRPFQIDRNYVCQLEAFAFFKNQRTFRLVNDTTLTPPWCLTFNTSGHSFSTGQLLATARLLGGNIRNGKLMFPGCFEGETLYQSITLHNTSNLPSTFRFETGFGENDFALASTGGTVDADAFSVRPLRGEVAAESFAVIYVRFTPSKSRKYTQLLRCFVNGDPSTKLLLEGTASIPFVCCPDVKSDDLTRPDTVKNVYGANNVEKVRSHLAVPGITVAPHSIPRGPLGSFYMKPTCVGLSTSRKFLLKNQSRLPLRYRITLPPEAEGILSITPTTGLLRGNQISKLAVAFAPQACMKYCLKIKVAIYPIGGRAQRVTDSRQPMGTASPEILQNISFLIIAAGEIGAVQFFPPLMAMDVRLVNTSERQDMYLENVSDSDLSYTLMYREEYVKDTGSTQSASASRDSKETSLIKPLVQANAESDESLMCDTPTGIIKARSRLRCPLTFQPTKAGTFDFTVFCQIQVSLNGTAQLLPNEEVALLRVSQRDRESSMEGAGEKSLVGIPLVARVTTRATFPKISIADVRLEHIGLVTNVENLWRNFSLKALNTELAKPLTEQECKCNASSSPDLSKLRRYKFEFTPDVLGAPQQKVSFLFKNNGHLTTNFHLHLPNEKELELEQWCDEDEPSEELNKIICMIEELKLFTIEPAFGTLEPGQSVNVSITYSHSHIKFGGVHNLPVHVKLDKGKQFFLELIGRTLPNTGMKAIQPTPSGSRALTAGARDKKVLPLTNINALPPTDILLTACAGQDSRIELGPVPVGLDPCEAPLQRMQLINVSAFKVIYDISLISLDHLNESNFGQPILRCANPMGEIEPRSSVYIEWYFFPLQSKAYEIPIVIAYERVAERGDMGGISEGLAQGSIHSVTSEFSGESVTPSLTLPPPPVGVKPPSGRGKVKSNASSPELKFTLIAPGFDPRDKILVDNKIQDRPRPGHGPKLTIFGEYPPSEQLITFQKQLASLSSDLLDLNFQPQGSKCSRMVVVRNLSSMAVEFGINVDNCRLCKEGLLTIFPQSGTLDVGEFVLIDFNFCLDTRSAVLSDDITVKVTEIIGSHDNRRGAMQNKLLSRALKKLPPPNHESVVKRITFVRNVQLETNLDHIPQGRKAAMPSTVAVDGNVIPGVSHAHPSDEDEGMMDASKAPNKAKSLGFENSFVGGSLSQSLVEDSHGSKAGRSATGQSGSSKIGGSGLMSRNRGKTEELKSKHGVTSSFTLRIRGFVLPFETAYKMCRLMGGTGVLLGLEERDAAAPVFDESGELELPKSGCMIDFFVPPHPKFVPFISASTFLNKAEAAPVKSKLANALSNLSREKEFEIRDVAQNIIHDLFGSVVHSASVREYIEEVVTDTAARSVTLDTINGAAMVNTTTLKVKGAIRKDIQLEGGALYGVYIDELNKQLGCVSNVDPNSAVASREIDHLAVNAKATNLMEGSQMGKVAVAMHMPSFPGIAADILANTMFNLMQEAAYEEFPITAEPLAFAIKEKK